MSATSTLQFIPPVQSLPKMVHVGTQIPSMPEPEGSAMSTLHFFPEPQSASVAQNFRHMRTGGLWSWPMPEQKPSAHVS